MHFLSGETQRLRSLYSLRRSRLSLSLALRRKRAREWRKFEAFSDVISRARFVYHATETAQEYDSDRAISYSRRSFGVRRSAGSSTKNLLESLSRHRFSLKHIRRVWTRRRTRRRLQRRTENTENDSTTNPTPTSTKYSFLSRRFVLHFFETRNA